MRSETESGAECCPVFLSSLLKQVVMLEIGGETGIRTLGGVTPTTVFETAPFDHSGTSPSTNLGVNLTVYIGQDQTCYRFDLIRLCRLRSLLGQVRGEPLRVRRQMRSTGQEWRHASPCATTTAPTTCRTTYDSGSGLSAWPSRPLSSVRPGPSGQRRRKGNRNGRMAT